MSLIEIILFFVLTFIATLGIIKHSKKLREEGIRSVMKSQSSIHGKVNAFIPKPNQSKETKSQSRNYVSERMIKIIAIDGKAYWVKDNVFFSADMIDGRVDRNTTKEVDTINMSKSELDKMLFIIDKLKDDEE